MDWLICERLRAGGAGGSPAECAVQMLPLLLIFVVFYFLLIRPQAKRAKEHKAMVAALGVGDEVVTSGGILGQDHRGRRAVPDRRDRRRRAGQGAASHGHQRPAEGHAEERLSARGAVRCIVTRPGRSGWSPSSLLRRAAARTAERVRRGARRCSCRATTARLPPKTAGATGRRTCWQPKGIAVEAAYLEGDRLVLRFDDVDQQLTARDVVAGGLGERVPGGAVAGARARPAWMRALGLKPMSLGLDLRGGVHFLYEVDVQGAVKQLLAGMERDYRAVAARRAHPVLRHRSNGDDTVRIALRSGDDADAGRGRSRKQDPNLDVDDGHAGAGGRVTVTLRPDADQAAPGLRDRAEHHDAAQPRRRTRRHRADRRAAGRGPHRRAAAGRAGPERGAARARRDRDARVPARRRPERSDEAERTKRAPLGSKLYQRARGRPGAAQARHDRLRRAAHRRELRLPRGPAGRHT